MSTAILHSEKKKMLVPKLRFQEFDGEWKEVKLGDYIKIKSGNSPSSHNFIDNGSYPFIKVEELNNCNKYQNASRFYANEKKNLVETFSVIFPKRGAAILNNKVRINDCPILMDSNMMAITPLRSKLNYEFLYYKIVKEELYKIADTSTIPQINNKHIEPYILFITSLPEQQKIASFLSAVDEKIQQLSRKKELLEQYKKGVMQQLFSGKLRFKDENGEDYPDWEEKKLGDLVKIKSGNSPSDYHFVNEGVNPFIKVEELNNCSKYQNKSRFYSNENKNLIETKSVIFPKRGAAILNNKVRINDCPILMDSNMMALIPLRKELDVEFLYSKIVMAELYKIADTSSIPQINNKHIEPYVISTPCLVEQQKIANFLSSIDTKIETVNGEIGKAQLFKKGLLQQMFV